jgi:hypothetical protein
MNQLKATGQTATSEHSTGELVKLVTEQVSVLVRDELKLAQLEMSGKAKQAGKGGHLRKATPPMPTEAVDSVKTDVAEIKERAHP